TVIELDGKRVFEQVAPRRLDEPQPFGRRYQYAVNKRPGIEDEPGIETGDQGGEINLKQQQRGKRERTEAQPRRGRTREVVRELPGRPQGRCINRRGQRQMKRQAILRDADALRQTRRYHPPTNRPECGSRTENRPQSRSKPGRNRAAPEKK